MNMIDLLSHNLLIGVVGFHCTHRCTVDGVDIDEYKPSAVHSSLGRNEQGKQVEGIESKKCFRNHRYGTSHPPPKRTQSCKRHSLSRITGDCASLSWCIKKPRHSSFLSLISKREPDWSALFQETFFLPGRYFRSSLLDQVMLSAKNLRNLEWGIEKTTTHFESLPQPRVYKYPICKSKTPFDYLATFENRKL